MTHNEFKKEIKGMNEETKTLIEDTKLNYVGSLCNIIDSMWEAVALAEEAGQHGNTPHDELLHSAMSIVETLKLYKNLLQEINELP